jgi:hypothetical protein
MARENEVFVGVVRVLVHGCSGLKRDWGVPQGVVLYKVTTVTGLFGVFKLAMGLAAKGGAPWCADRSTLEFRSWTCCCQASN